MRSLESFHFRSMGIFQQNQFLFFGFCFRIDQPQCGMVAQEQPYVKAWVGSGKPICQALSASEKLSLT